MIELDLRDVYEACKEVAEEKARIITEKNQAKK